MVQTWMKENVFGQMQDLQDILMGQVLVTGAIVLSFISIFLCALIKINKTPKITNAIKEKLMYSPIFRGQIQFFFPTCLLSIIILTQCDKKHHEDFEQECAKYS